MLMLMKKFNVKNILLNFNFTQIQDIIKDLNWSVFFQIWLKHEILSDYDESENTKKTYLSPMINNTNLFVWFFIIKY